MGPETETKEEGSTLAPHGLLSLFSSSTWEPPAHRQPHHRRVGPPTSIINQENAPRVCLWTNLIEAFSQLSLPLLRCPELVLRYHTHTHTHTHTNNNNKNHLAQLKIQLPGQGTAQSMFHRAWSSSEKGTAMIQERDWEGPESFGVVFSEKWCG